MNIFPETVHTPWCAVHDHIDDRDTICRSHVQTFITLDSAPNDLDAVEVSVERRSDRGAGATQWHHRHPRIYLSCVRDGGADLTPAEAREAAGLLLAAAALAEQPADTNGPRECVDCGCLFAWDESPDDQRCAHCADINTWRQDEAA